MIEKKTIWIVDDDKSIRWVLEKALTREDLQVVCFDGSQKMLSRFNRETPDVIISDIRMPDMDGIALMNEIKSHAPHLPVIIMTAYSDLDRAVLAFQSGAFEFLSKPFDVDDVVNLVKRAIKEAESKTNDMANDDVVSNTEIIGSAAAMQEVFRAIGRLSSSILTVLITGESGTGKELVAKALHKHSPCSEGPFIALNTAAIPRELLESELFGHEKGAFTGANERRIGRFEQADGGTLFLDEIGDMPSELQTRLLRVLADGEFYRVGGHIHIKVNVRVIAATHQDLESKVKNGSFREDLFHRLNVIRVHAPSLRDRRDDIPLLTEHFLRQAAKELNVDTKQISRDTQAYLDSLLWPGNVRQLENFCRWATVMASGKEIHLEDLPPELKYSQDSDTSRGNWEDNLRTWVESNLIKGETSLLADAVPRFERIMIEEALKKSGGRRQDAARLLGWGRNTLTRKIRSLGLDD